MAAVDKEFDYTVPESLAGQVRLGSRVRVALGKRRVGGWVTACGVEAAPGVRLRALAGWSGHGPPAPVVDLARWASWRWAGPMAAFLSSASPARVVRELGGPSHPGAPVAPETPDPTWEDALAAGSSVVLRMPPTGDLAGTVLRAARLAGDGTRSVVVLAPTRAQVGALTMELRAAGHPVAVLPGDWAEAASGGRVVLGSRGAAFAPVPRLAAALILDAHDDAYREQRAPTWDAWRVLAQRAQRERARCIAVSPCPTLEQLRWGVLVTYPRVDERRGWAPLELVDLRRADPRQGLVSARLARAIRLGQPGRPVVCVINRTGRAQLLACGQCRNLLVCEACGASLRQLARDEDLVCRGCGETQVAACATCGSRRLRLLRPGVARLREELEALSRGVVAEVTGTIGEPASRDAAVVVGTNASLNRITRASAVVFLDFDQELTAPSYRAAERSLSLLAAASRAVGGREGRVLVQTRLPDHAVIDAALHADPGRLSRTESAVRRELRLPPWSAMAILSGDRASEAAEKLSAAGLVTSGPYRGRWVVRAERHSTLCDALEGIGQRRGLRIEVDPING